MREFFGRTNRRLRRIYLFCDSTNAVGRAFYEARGFRVEAVLKDFYHDCDAIFFVRNMADGTAA